MTARQGVKPAAATFAATSARRVAAMALPSISRAVTGSPIGGQNRGVAGNVQGLVAAGLAERDGDGRGRDVQRARQHGAGGAVGPAVLGRLVDADTQAGPVGGHRAALDAGPAGFRLDLHGDADAVRECAPE